MVIFIFFSVKISKYENDQAKCAEVQRDFEALQKSSEQLRSSVTDHDEKFKEIFKEK